MSDMVVTARLVADSSSWWQLQASRRRSTPHRHHRQHRGRQNPKPPRSAKVRPSAAAASSRPVAGAAIAAYAKKSVDAFYPPQAPASKPSAPWRHHRAGLGLPGAAKLAASTPSASSSPSDCSTRSSSQPTTEAAKPQP